MTHVEEGGGTRHPICERRVGVRIPPVNGGGRLIARLGRVELITGHPTRALSGVERVVQTRGPLRLTTARLVPPWCNVALTVRDDTTGTVAYAVTWIPGRASLVASLRAAGFEVDQVSSWLSLGGGDRREGREKEPARTPSAGLPWPALVAIVAAAIAASVLFINHSLTFVGLIGLCAALTLILARPR